MNEHRTRMIEMSLSDANDLDAVVRALGIEDSVITPAEAVIELQCEISTLREKNVLLQATLKRTNEIIDKLTATLARQKGIL